MKKTVHILFLIIILFSFSAYAEKGHMTLLTVGERGNETMGGTADVYLEVTSGSGRVFIDSFPLTKLDTQISTRFAKEVACDFLEQDCSNKDFFYTIRAKSSVVGGPSAGAALTVLTISVLEDMDLDESVVMTGTINSGGIIGPVAGIEEKAQAAKREGFRKALVPKRSIISAVDSNLSVQIDEKNKNEGDGSKNITLVYSDSLEVEGIEIVPISTIEDALFHFTGEKYPDYSYELDVPEKYMGVMKKVSSDICQRTKEIIQIIPPHVLENQSEKYNLSKSFVEKAESAFGEMDYYTAASFCFNANRYLRDIEYSQYSDEALSLIERDVKQELEKMIEEIDGKPLHTLSELETSMVVKERLFEAEDLLKSYSANGSYKYEDLAYIVERTYSAKAWSAFFDYQGKEVVLDENHLSGACLEKIAEAEERINYFEILFGEYEDYREELEDVRGIYGSGDYAFCLFKASKIKADVNAILTSLSITDEKFQELLDDQLRLARVQINKQGDDFPIIGYSYYNYAESLKEARPELSLIYSEYASEFSNLDMYFPREKRESFFIDRIQLGLFLLGFSAGIFFVMLFFAVFAGYRKRKTRKQDGEDYSVQKKAGSKVTLKKFRPAKKKRS